MRKVSREMVKLWCIHIMEEESRSVWNWPVCHLDDPCLLFSGTLFNIFFPFSFIKAFLRK